MAQSVDGLIGQLNMLIVDARKSQRQRDAALGEQITQLKLQNEMQAREIAELKKQIALLVYNLTDALKTEIENQ